MTTVRAVVREGRVEPPESVNVPEGTEALATLITDVEDADFWRQASGLAADIV